MQQPMTSATEALVVEGDAPPTLNTELFLEQLARLERSEWEISIEDRCIHLRLRDMRRTDGMKPDAAIFSPLTAVYYCLTGEIIHRGSFLLPEMTERFGFPWWEILAVTYASIACDCAGQQYSRPLRNQMLAALGEPVTVERSAL